MILRLSPSGRLTSHFLCCIYPHCRYLHYILYTIYYIPTLQLCIYTTQSTHLVDIYTVFYRYTLYYPLCRYLDYVPTLCTTMAPLCVQLGSWSGSGGRAEGQQRLALSHRTHRQRESREPAMVCLLTQIAGDICINKMHFR